MEEKVFQALFMHAEEIIVGVSLNTWAKPNCKHIEVQFWEQDAVWINESMKNTTDG